MPLWNRITLTRAFYIFLETQLFTLNNQIILMGNANQPESSQLDIKVTSKESPLDKEIAQLIPAKMLIDQFQRYWGSQENLFLNSKLSTLEMEVLTQTQVSDCDQWKACFTAQEWACMQLLHLQTKLVKINLIPNQMPLIAFPEDPLHQFQNTYFQQRLSSNYNLFNEDENQIFHSSFREDFQDYFRNNQDPQINQLLNELRWVMLKSNQPILKNFYSIHPLILLIYSIQKIVQAHCTFCQLIITSLPHSLLQYKLYLIFWTSFQSSMDHFNQMFNTALKCFNYCFPKNESFPQFNIHYIMPKIWGQTFDVNSLFDNFQTIYFQLWQQSDNLLPELAQIFNALMDIMLNQHSVNWIGHFDAQYPKQLLDFLTKVQKENEQQLLQIQPQGINALHLLYLSIFENSNYLLENSQIQKKIFNEPIYEIYLQQSSINVLKELLKVDLKPRILELFSNSELDKYEEEESLLESNFLDILKESQINVMDYLIDKEIRTNGLLIDIVKSALQSKLTEQSSKSSQFQQESSSYSHLSTQPLSSSFQIYQQKSPQSIIAKRIAQQLSEEQFPHKGILDQLQKDQGERYVNIQKRNKNIEVRNEQQNIKFDILEEMQKFFSFQRELRLEEVEILNMKQEKLDNCEIKEKQFYFLPIENLKKYNAGIKMAEFVMKEVS